MQHKRPRNGRAAVPVSLSLLCAVCAASCAAQTANVLTFHNDSARTGQNLVEGILTPQNVNASTFGKLFTVPMDGKVDAQPLYITSLLVSGHRHNVVFAATEHDSVYAFDADTGTVYWQVSMLGSGETTSDTRGCGQITPEIGVTATPVIDLAAGPHGTIYVVAMSKNGAGSYFQRLHALDLTTGAEQFGGPTTIQASVTGTGNSTIFDAKQYKDRPGLLLANGIVYTSFASHCDFEPYAGWSIGYNGKTLAQTGVFNFAPNGSEAAPWNSGGGPGADAQGNIYYSIGNGTFDTTLNAGGFPNQGDYGNAFVKLSTTGGSLQATDYWTMDNTVSESGYDSDLGSGGMIVLPDLIDAQGKVRHLLAGGGKDTNLYLLDRDNMGKFDAAENATIYQELVGALPGGTWSNPAYYNGSVYFNSIGNTIRAFTLTNAKLGTQPSSSTKESFAYPGANPTISAYGTANPILWAVSNTPSSGLYAYNANNLQTKYYDSTQAANSRDTFGAGNKFIVPTIANGKVYVGTTNSIGVFGLLHNTQGPIADGVYTLTNTYSGFVLDDPYLSSSPGTQMIQYPANQGPNQGWFFASQGTGFYTIQNTSSGLYLTDTGASTTPLLPLQQQLRVYDDTQLWSLVPSGSGGYFIQNKATGLVIDDAYASKDPLNGMILWPMHQSDSSNQVWTIQ